MELESFAQDVAKDVIPSVVVQKRFEQLINALETLVATGVMLNCANRSYSVVVTIPKSHVRPDGIRRHSPFFIQRDA